MVHLLNFQATVLANNMKYFFMLKRSKKYTFYYTIIVFNTGVPASANTGKDMILMFLEDF